MAAFSFAGFIGLTVQTGSETQKIRVLVVGATGFTGPAVCVALTNAGFFVVASGRQLPARLVCDEFVCLDLEQSEFSADLLQRIDVVIYLAAIAHAGRHVDIPFSRYKAVNCDAAVRLAMLARQNGVKMFHYVSSVKAMGYDACEAILDESAACVPQDAYGKTKRAAELQLLELARDTSMKITISRPALIYGVQVRGNLARLAHYAQWRWAPALPEAGSRSMLALDDFAVALSVFAQDGGQHQGIYILAGETRTANALVAAMRSAIPLPAFSWKLPLLLFRMLAHAGDFLRKLGIAAPWDREQHEKLFGQLCFDSTRAQRELGWRPRIRFEDEVVALMQARDT